MANYLYFLHEERPLDQRFIFENTSGRDYNIDGLDDWHELISRLLKLLYLEKNKEYFNWAQDIRSQTLNELTKITGNNFNIYEHVHLLRDRSTEEFIAILLLLRLRKFSTLPKKKCPRLFVSHRRTDKLYALRIAKLAQDNGFAYWIDVLDPNLHMLNNSIIPEKLKSIITACIIEFALINCSHVLACLTEESRGSMWIPYEYGRVKKLPGISINACTWIHPNLPKKDLPEYMILGEIVFDEINLESWLKIEYNLNFKNYCDLKKTDNAFFKEVDKLPVLSDDELEREQLYYDKWLSSGLPTTKDIKLTPTFRIKIRKKNP